jgi:hypothetical protein
LTTAWEKISAGSPGDWSVPDVPGLLVLGYCPRCDKRTTKSRKTEVVSLEEDKLCGSY